MPTLDRRLLAWSDDSDTEDGGDRLLLVATPTSPRGLAAGGGDDGSYDRACASVDDVLVPAGADDDDGRADKSSTSGTRKVSSIIRLICT
jgi:hypothetical protein